MRAEIAEIIFPVFRTAIEIIKGLRSGKDDWQFNDCQRKLLGMLQAPVPDHLRAEIHGDLRSYEQVRDTLAGGTVTSFLGLRYAMACWLDEVFIEFSPWKEEWSNNSIEVTLYSIRLRSHMFWEQAQRAQARSTRDAIEACYLCVMLGFRGDLAGNPNELNAWRDAIETPIIEAEDRTYEPPPRLNITTNVPVLSGAIQMQQYALFATVAGLIYIPLLVILVFQLLQ